MSRRYSTGRSSNVTLAVCDTIVGKENAYKQGILDNHSLCRDTAQRLAIRSDDDDNNNRSVGRAGPSLESTLLSMTKGDNAVLSEEDVQSFMTEQRDRLKKIVKTNVATERYVGHFVGAVRSLKQQVLADEGGDQARAANDDDNGEDDLADYEPVIQQLMAQHQSQGQSTLLPLEQEEMYREVCDIMGEALAPAAKKKNGGNDDDDDEIEVVRNGTSQTQSLKCPVTTMLMEDPVKNTVCGHVYSREGILQLIRNKGNRCKCPVPGCSNYSVTESQLTKDAETERYVKRERRRQEHATQVRASQADDLVDTDDEG